MDVPSLPLGVRNNNPGNIRRSARGPVWHGEIWPGHDEAFCTFATPMDGIRALAITLNSYVYRDGCRTIRSVISRWAPPVENKTASYIDFVLERIGHGATADMAFDWGNYAQLVAVVTAIIAEECADYAYPVETVRAGIFAAAQSVIGAAAG